MSSIKHSLSIALLMFNEEENIATVLDETLAFCRGALDDWEIVVVDDGSTDGSVSIVQQYIESEARVRLVRHETNQGMGAGIRTGIENATKEYFIFNASDGQIAAAEIGVLLPLLERADIALSTYANRRETLARELTSRSFRFYLQVVAGIRFELQGLYLYPTKSAKELAPLIEADTFFFSFELIQRGVERGLTIANTWMTCRPREAGSSKVFNPSRIIRVGKEALGYGIRKRLGSR
ncbi:MAG: glycosyltransferase family 2 protein [Deltaproteobacteria bacterium]|nr:glycosyltransferase family 2 protein [Deltaproteobacteria bacterium]